MMRRFDFGLVIIAGLVGGLIVNCCGINAALTVIISQLLIMQVKGGW